MKRALYEECAEVIGAVTGFLNGEVSRNKAFQSISTLNKHIDESQSIEVISISATELEYAIKMLEFDSSTSDVYDALKAMIESFEQETSE